MVGWVYHIIAHHITGVWGLVYSSLRQTCVKQRVKGHSTELGKVSSFNGGRGLTNSQGPGFFPPPQIVTVPTFTALAAINHGFINPGLTLHLGKKKR